MTKYNVVERRTMTFVVTGSDAEFLNEIEEFVRWIREDHGEWLYFSEFDYSDTGKFAMEYVDQAVATTA